MTALAATRFDNTLRYRDEDDPRQVQFTPPYILEPVRDWLGYIELDPCTTPDNPTRAWTFYAPPQDGAALPWDAGTAFVNPPYGKARERWVRRCIEAAVDGCAVALLIPAHPDTRIFHLALETASWVLFIRGRVKFGVLRPNRRQAAASHPSALIAWGDRPTADLAALGTVVRAEMAWPSAVHVYDPDNSKPGCLAKLRASPAESSDPRPQLPLGGGPVEDSAGVREHTTRTRTAGA